MMRMRNMTNRGSPINGNEQRGIEWEMRPGGMLVQRRTGHSDLNPVQTPTIRVRVKYGSTYHQLNISSQATFGELKKMLTGPTGLHHQDQKLYYKEKERDSKVFLDMVGVKDKSKIVVMEDPISKEKRYLEMMKNAKMEKAAKSISEISLEVDRLAGRVSAFESIISKGGKVVESDMLGLIELLMNQLLKLDGIIVDGGDIKLQRKMQVKRVQKYVETLDILKTKNSPQQKHSNGVHNKLARIEEQQEEASNNNSTSSKMVVTTNWETFDNLAPLIPITCTTSTSTASSDTNNSVHHKFNWEFFD
ncbi:hypothetical protein TanjilG_04668 [Lupinus angustifolius]|uniref:Ubiquitin-like domain-containing protein n=1 Tax=Lupinus angustifolius TaxID=3871 RepID=A0A4P1RK98_LUPAN|nr:PREDICTED: BAG family molecular chaperone regulator 1-like isoform X1 [Lupinus angustifolius]OIW12504.1 hypothetical protein TanjilG_04668 [Lupinus angustifolius]